MLFVTEGHFACACIDVRAITLQKRREVPVSRNLNLFVLYKRVVVKNQLGNREKDKHAVLEKRTTTDILESRAGINKQSVL